MEKKTYLVVLKSGGGRGYIATGISSNPNTFGQQSDRVRRLDEGVGDRLEAISGEKPTFKKRRREYRASLTEAQVQEVQGWEHVRQVIPEEDD